MLEIEVKLKSFIFQKIFSLVSTIIITEKKSNLIQGELL